MSGQAFPPDAMTLSAVAKLRGISRQAVHRRARALQAAGHLEFYTDGSRRVFVSLSAFDFAVDKHGDPGREAAVVSAAILTETPSSSRSDEGTLEDSKGYREAKARDAYYTAEIKRLNYEREQRQLYTVAEVNEALERITGRIIERLGNLNSHADDGMEACEQGMPHFRRWLSDLGDNLRRELAADLRIIEQEAEALPLEDTETENNNTDDET